MVRFTRKRNPTSLLVLFSRAVTKWLVLIIHVQAARCVLPSHPPGEPFAVNANKYHVKLIHFPICLGFESNMD